MKKLVVFILLILISAPFVAFANGGDQRVVDGKYLINLSRSPFTPRVGVETSMLASFVDIDKDKLIAEDLLVKVRIAQLGGAGKREFLFEEDNLIVQGGVLEFVHTFTATGLHEVFFDFAFASDPQKIYEAPDFLMDVQIADGAVSQHTNRFTIGFIVGVFAGVMLGFVFGLRFGVRK